MNPALPSYCPRPTRWLVVLGACAPLLLSAATYTWTQTAGGAQSWAVASNWDTDPVVPAPVSGDTVDFSTVNIAADTALTLGADRTAQLWRFGDASGTQNWTVNSGNQILLAGTTPTVQVVNNTTTLNAAVGGASGLTKAGAGTLILGNANLYVGGTTIGEGRIVVSADNNLGDAAGGVTFTGTQGALILPAVSGPTTPIGATRTFTSQPGALGVISRPNVNNVGIINMGSQFTGAGGFQFATAYQLGGVTYNLSHANNDFQGVLRIGGNYSGPFTFTPSTVTANFTSFADGPGYGNIQFGRGNNNSGNILTFAYAGTAADLVLDHRRIELDSVAETAQITNNSATRAVVINTDLLVSRINNKTLRLSGVSNPNPSVFAGNIANGNVAAATQVISLDKQGAATWALAGNNSYSGTTLVRQGLLVFRGASAVSPASTLILNHLSGNSGSMRLLDDTAGLIALPNTLQIQTQNATGNHNIFVGNNNTVNGGDSGGTTTGSTIQLANLEFTTVNGDTQYQSINATGPNNYSLRFNNVLLSNLVTRNAGQVTETRFNPTTADISLGNITMATGNTGTANDGIPRLVLTGTSSGNQVTGGISDAADVLTGQPLSLLKNGTSTWTLSGNSSYTGDTTLAANGGTLAIGGGGLLGGGDYAGTLTINNGSTFRHNASSTQTLSGALAGGATGLLLKDGTGTLILGGSSSFVGNTRLSAGTLRLGSAGGFLTEERLEFAAPSGTATFDLNGFNQRLRQITDNGVDDTARIDNSSSDPATLTLRSTPGASTFNGQIHNTGGGALTVEVGLNTGTPPAISLTLGGTGGSTFTGPLRVQPNGTLIVTTGEESSLGAATGPNALTLNGGTLQVSTADLTIDDSGRDILVDGGNFGSHSGGTFLVDGGRVLNIANTVDGAGITVRKAGAGTVNFTGLTRAGTFLQLDGVTDISGGDLRVNALNLSGGSFNWGDGRISLLNRIGADGAVDYSSSLDPAGPEVRVGRTMNVTGSLTTELGSILEIHGSPTFYENANVRFNQISLTGVLDLSAADDTLEVEIVTSLLRGDTDIEYGSIPLITAAQIIGTFDTFGSVTSGATFVEYTGVFTDAASLPDDTWYLQYADTADPDALADTLYFHYRLTPTFIDGAWAGVPEPGTLSLAAFGMAALRVLRRQRPEPTPPPSSLAPPRSRRGGRERGARFALRY
jgi:autotransporter-associated beta strand protein